MDRQSFNKMLVDAELPKEEFAKKFNISKATVNGWGSNRNNIPYWVESWLNYYIELREIKKALFTDMGIDMNNLLDGEETKNIGPKLRDEPAISIFERFKRYINNQETKNDYIKNSVYPHCESNIKEELGDAQDFTKSIESLKIEIEEEQNRRFEEFKKNLKINNP